MKKYKENHVVVNAILSHHGDVEPKTIEAVLVAAADAISGARPGARRETTTNYVKRLQKLEELAGDFKGVDKCYAIQAGREIRVMVKPEQVDDSQTLFLAKEIAKKIESELEYPGKSTSLGNGARRNSQNNRKGERSLSFLIEYLFIKPFIYF